MSEEKYDGEYIAYFKVTHEGQEVYATVNAYKHHRPSDPEGEWAGTAEVNGKRFLLFTFNKSMDQDKINMVYRAPRLETSNYELIKEIFRQAQEMGLDWGTTQKRPARDN